MLSVEHGRVVRSLAGKEKGTLMAAVGFTDRVVLLADGRQRPLERPKRKNIRHVALTEYVLEPGEMATNRGLRRALRALESE